MLLFSRVQAAAPYSYFPRFRKAVPDCGKLTTNNVRVVGRAPLLAKSPTWFMIRSLTSSGVETAGSEMVQERKGGLLQPLGFAEIEELFCKGMAATTSLEPRPLP
ncbi:MAG: hypothetical protein DMG34_17805 [Acidobacteria bacterium]|nr:MAG: hypothetical protein DMG34_17805 [Acidobacteriota bacterium]